MPPPRATPLLERGLSADGRSYDEARPSCARAQGGKTNVSRRHALRALFLQFFRVRCYEVGPDHLAMMVTVANLLQEVAANHAQCMWGEGCWAPAVMRDSGAAFALSKLHIRMDAPVRWCVARLSAAARDGRSAQCSGFTSIRKGPVR